MWDLLYYLVLIVLLAGALVGGAWLLRGYLNGTAVGVSFFGPKPDPRIGVIEQANVDGRRKLLLIRRDDVEHLIMTGGPVDVVLETGIGQRRTRTAEVVEAPAAVFSRAPRSFGQAAGGEP